MKILRSVIITAMVVMAAAGCKSSKSLLPNISGQASEVLVVMDKDAWEGTSGDLLRENLACPCPYLAQREPLYSLVSITPSLFKEQMFLIHRNILYYSIYPDVVKPGINVGYDKWAKPQLVLTVCAPSYSVADSLVKAKMPLILSSIETIERDRVIANTRQYPQRELTAPMRKLTGGDMVFPSGYKLKKKTDDFIWISYETMYVQQGIMAYRYGASGISEIDLGVEALTAARNTALRANVPGMVEGSYMTTATAIPPYVEYTRYKGRSFAQMHGFWEVEGDFMGGPFTSHSFYSPDGRDIICLEAYVYAPKYDKRQYLRQVESLLYAFEWAADKEEK